MDLLKKGDTVAIVATARKVSEEEMLPAKGILESWGLKVIWAEGLFEAENQFSNSDKARSHSFQQLLNNPAIKAIFCARGGYGTVRMVDDIDFDIFLDDSKWIIGYSDITVLHAHIHKHIAYTTVHGPMPINWLPEKLHEESLTFLQKTLFEGPQGFDFPNHPLNLRSAEAEGIVIGGNLSVLYSLLGSNSDPNYDGKILVLEDLDEYLYHIDRMMVALKRAGKFNHLEAVVVGDMSDMKDNTVPFGKNAYEIIADAFKDFEYPVFFGVPVGHEPRNLTLLFGRRYQLKPGKKVRFEPIQR